MHVRRADGSYGLVWWAWNIEHTQVMYNLTVDTAHTFFVGQGQWLAHNQCGPGLPNPVYDEASAAHVGPRHVDVNTFPNKSKFLSGEEGQSLTDEIFNNPAKIEMQTDGFARIYADLGRVVGTQGETWARLVMNSETGWVKTMFPQFP